MPKSRHYLSLAWSYWYSLRSRHLRVRRSMSSASIVDGQNICCRKDIVERFLTTNQAQIQMTIRIPAWIPIEALSCQWRACLWRLTCLESRKMMQFQLQKYLPELKTFLSRKYPHISTDSETARITTLYIFPSGNYIVYYYIIRLYCFRYSQETSDKVVLFFDENKINK